MIILNIARLFFHMETNCKNCNMMSLDLKNSKLLERSFETILKLTFQGISVPWLDRLESLVIENNSNLNYSTFRVLKKGLKVLIPYF